jgi:hypothetical protein
MTPSPGPHPGLPAPKTAARGHPLGVQGSCEGGGQPVEDLQQGSHHRIHLLRLICSCIRCTAAAAGGHGNRQEAAVCCGRALVRGPGKGHDSMDPDHHGYRQLSPACHGRPHAWPPSSHAQVGLSTVRGHQAAMHRLACHQCMATKQPCTGWPVISAWPPSSHAQVSLATVRGHQATTHMLVCQHCMAFALCLDAGGQSTPGSCAIPIVEVSNWGWS